MPIFRPIVIAQKLSPFYRNARLFQPEHLYLYRPIPSWRPGPFGAYRIHPGFRITVSQESVFIHVVFQRSFHSGFNYRKHQADKIGVASVFNVPITGNHKPGSAISCIINNVIEHDPIWDSAIVWRKLILVLKFGKR